MTESHATDTANRIELQTIDPAEPGGADLQENAFAYDATGNLIDRNTLHGGPEFIYDAWNRLVEVRDADDSSLIKKYRYDALHRKINAQAEHFPGELYYYDGHRVLDFYLTQTVNVECPDPPDPGGGGTENKSTQSNNPSESGAQLAADNIYESLKSSSKDSTVTFGGGGGGGGGDPTGCTALLTPLERSYVYGPHYIDEQVAQFNQGGGRYYVLQDANYNVVALTDAFGALHRQFSYEPYGDLFAAEKGPSATAINLSSANLDDELDNWIFAGGVELDHQTRQYYQRGRWYSPTLARFLQPDPSELALFATQSLAFNGESSDLLSLISPDGQYTNGMNRYERTGSSPIDRLDPSGLMYEEDGFWGESEYGDDLLVTRDWDEIFDSIVGQEYAYLGVQGAATWGGFWGGNVSSLPRFAAHASAISAGVSDFADDYADQLIWLPVEGALAGFGQFGQFATVGEAASQARTGARAGKLAKDAIHGTYFAFARASKIRGAIGQIHHAISKKVWRQLQKHSKLRGKFKLRDPRFATRAKDLGAHNGYETWHRDLDDEIIRWIKDNKKATPEQFISYLRDRYKEADLLDRFPDALK